MELRPPRAPPCAGASPVSAVTRGASWPQRRERRLGDVMAPSLPQRKQPGPDDMPGSDATRSAVVQTCKNLRRSQDIHSGSRESAPIAADSRPRPLHTSGRAVSRLVASGLAGVPIPGVPGRVGNGSRSTDQDQPASCRCGADGHGGTSRVCPTTARTAQGRARSRQSRALCRWRQPDWR